MVKIQSIFSSFKHIRALCDNFPVSHHHEYRSDFDVTIRLLKLYLISHKCILTNLDKMIILIRKHDLPP